VVDVLYPFLGVVLIFTSKGLIKFAVNNKKSIYPQLLFGMLIISAVCIIRGAASGGVYDASTIWVPGLISTAVLTGAFLSTGINKSMPAIGQGFLVLIFAVMIGFGGMLHINDIFDDGPYQVYHATVVDKSISRGRSTSYYLQTSSWGPKNKSINANVGSRMFNNTNIGDTIKIYFERGALNIPLYKVSRR
jgi:hypothetical protein